MKKLIYLFLLILTGSAVQAQYKKASFLNRGGRTYELGAGWHNFGEGKGAQFGYRLVFGSDNTEKRAFSNCEFEFIPKFNYQYSTTATEYQGVDEVTVPVEVRGKARNQWLLHYTFGFHLLDRTGEEPRFQPYLHLGPSFVISGGSNSHEISNPNISQLEKGPANKAFTLGLRGGAGLIALLNDAFAIRAELGYAAIYNLEPDETYPSTYFIYTNHLFASIGIRFRLNQD